MTSWAIDLVKPGQNRAVAAALKRLGQQTGVVLADPVGCGKTFEALAVLAQLARGFEARAGRADNFRAVIICKTSLVAKWKREISQTANSSAQEHREDRFLDYLLRAGWTMEHPFIRACLRVVDVLNRASARNNTAVRRSRGGEVEPGIYILNPNLLSPKTRRRNPWLNRFLTTAWDVVIVDEAHHAAKPGSVMAGIFGGSENDYSGPRIGLSRDGRIVALTATPFELDPAQLANLLRVIQAAPADIKDVASGLNEYAKGLDSLYAHRNRGEAGRKELVSALEKRKKDGLEKLLQKYLIRNEREEVLQRNYAVVERHAQGHQLRPFQKLGDVAGLLASSPLIPFTGPDALLYFELRSYIAARQATSDPSGRTFVATELRQGLSSYPQLHRSGLIARAKDSVRFRRLHDLLARWTQPGTTQRLHPKVVALLDQVTQISEEEIRRYRRGEVETPAKIVVFNRMIGGTAPHLAKLLNNRLHQVFIEAAKSDCQRLGLPDLLTIKARMRSYLGDRVASLSREHRWSVRMPAASERRSDGETAVPPCLGTLVRTRLQRRAGAPLTLVRFAGDSHPLAPEAWAERHLVAPCLAAITALARRLADPDARETDAVNANAGDMVDDLSTVGLCARFDGTESREVRERHRRVFNSVDAPYVLLVSSVGEEGIDLQSWASHIIHYDVEWNPARMEQREGRIDRIGRKDTGIQALDVRFLLLKGTYEERIFSSVMRREQWFQVLIGAQKRSLGKSQQDEDTSADGSDEVIPEVAEVDSALTQKEMQSITMDLRPG